jgi:hypothetical protein
MMALACVNMLHQNTGLMLQVPEKFLQVMSEYLQEIASQTESTNSST